MEKTNHQKLELEELKEKLKKLSDEDLDYIQWLLETLCTGNCEYIRNMPSEEIYAYWKNNIRTVTV